MVARHTKMYANSPKLERDNDSGKVKVSKAEKKSAEVASGTDGIEQHDSHIAVLAQKHEKELFDLYQKHKSDYQEVMQKAVTTGGATEQSKEGE